MILMRAFIAIDLSEEIKEKIREIQEEFSDIRGNLKFVDAKQAHITLKFLGEVPSEGIERVKEALEEIDYEKFNIELRGIGFFPKAPLQKVRNIRVIWVGVEMGEEKLKELQEEVEARMTMLGFPAEEKFSAHVTICRTKKLSRESVEKVLRKITMLKNAYIGRMLVEVIKLKKSTLTPKGPIYEDVHIKKLG
ncbi:MAG: RNA 2',3'-cyclic phosphodiesterase [Candidatus Methanospirareceae archaeon]